MYLAPKQLRPGDKVAIVAPASPFKADELLDGLDIIKEAGLIPVLGQNVRNLRSASIHAANIDDRVKELIWAFEDPTIKAVIAATGGCGSAGVLPYLDYECIARSRKVVLGMSDITALNVGLLSRARLITFNGQSPNIRLDEGTYIREADTESFRTTLELLMSDRPWFDTPFKMNKFLPRTIAPGTASGHIIGCNIDTLSRLLGTSYTPNFAGSILFLEDVHKGGESLSRELLHMKLAGVLDQCAGIVIGEFYDVPKNKYNEREQNIEDVLHEYFAIDGGPPCVYGYSFSHGDYTIPIPIGATCDMDADTGNISFRFAMCR